VQNFFCGLAEWLRPMESEKVGIENIKARCSSEAILRGHVIGGQINGRGCTMKREPASSAAMWTKGCHITMQNQTECSVTNVHVQRASRCVRCMFACDRGEGHGWDTALGLCVVLLCKGLRGVSCLFTEPGVLWANGTRRWIEALEWWTRW
jgi:hypothetical protein